MPMPVLLACWNDMVKQEFDIQWVGCCKCIPINYFGVSRVYKYMKHGGIEHWE